MPTSPLPPLATALLRWAAPRLLLALAVALLGAGCVVVPARRAPPLPPPSGAVVLERWAERHPEASRELGGWVHAQPKAAARFFRWDSRHPGAAQAFVTWAQEHPRAEAVAFLRSHGDWVELDEVIAHHPVAADQLADWCRRHPAAARDLMAHPAGLHWAGTHLYKAAWELDTQ
jgi:ABC-type nitrate/sulfonate/bicarbonate transport system substrate-binding protein